MTDTTNSVADALRTRVTPATLGGPAPDAETLKLAYEAALAAPDHGNIRPVRFITIPEDKLEAFGAVLVDAMKRRMPTADAAALEREAAKVRRSPLIVVAAAKLVERKGVPQVEQLVAAGAAVQNFSSVLYSRGFATSWKTGDPAYDEYVKQKLGLEPNDAIIGFLYVGTPTMTPTRPRLKPEQIVSTWGA